ncbi:MULTISPECIES: hypothetical protein [Anaerobacillus]|uniref:hypothetical protein n=1 Tax=Anaerobacillus TaxID=704093 RepID=UPI00147130F1|nr:MULTISPECIES: hypothetical protein [Anaerobacillus]
MVYLLISLTIVVYFLIVIRIFHGINDEKTISIVSKVKNFFKANSMNTFKTNIK